MTYLDLYREQQQKQNFFVNLLMELFLIFDLTIKLRIWYNYMPFSHLHSWYIISTIIVWIDYSVSFISKVLPYIVSRIWNIWRKREFECWIEEHLCEWCVLWETFEFFCCTKHIKMMPIYFSILLSFASNFFSFFYSTSSTEMRNHFKWAPTK